MESKTAYNSIFAIGSVSCSADSFVVIENLVFNNYICNKIRPSQNMQNVSGKFMKRHLTILTFLFLTTFTYGQVKKIIDIQTYKNGDTTLWYKWRYELSGQLKINKLINSADTFHFRFWQDGQALDIWTTDNKTFQGQVTNYVKKYNPNKWKKENPKPDKVIANQIKLDTGQAREAYNLIIEYSILTIPTDEKIKGWSQGLDGVTYLIEISTTNSYVFKSYWTPTAQDSLLEAKKIQIFVDKINSLLKLEVSRPEIGLQ